MMLSPSIVMNLCQKIFLWYASVVSEKNFRASKGARASDRDSDRDIDRTRARNDARDTPASSCDTDARDTPANSCDTDASTDVVRSTVRSILPSHVRGVEKPINALSDARDRVRDSVPF